MNSPLATNGFEIRFAPLAAPGPVLSFPCDAGGHVDLDALSSGSRNRYFFARTLIGRDYSPPCVCRRCAQA